MSKVRTNIEIENTHLQTIMDRYGLRTKTEAVDLDAIGRRFGPAAPLRRTVSLALS